MKTKISLGLLCLSIPFLTLSTSAQAADPFNFKVFSVNTQKPTYNIGEKVIVDWQMDADIEQAYLQSTYEYDMKIEISQTKSTLADPSCKRGITRSVPFSRNYFYGDNYTTFSSYSKLVIENNELCPAEYQVRANLGYKGSNNYSSIAYFTVQGTQEKTSVVEQDTSETSIQEESIQTEQLPLVTPNPIAKPHRPSIQKVPKTIIKPKIFSVKLDRNKISFQKMNLNKITISVQKKQKNKWKTVQTYITKKSKISFKKTLKTGKYRVKFASKDYQKSFILKIKK